MPLLLSVSDNVWAYRSDMLQGALKTILAEPLMALVYLNALLLSGPDHHREENRLAALQKLLYEMWGVPARTAQELKSEMESAGFRVLRAIPTPSTRLFPQRGLLLAQRP